MTKTLPVISLTLKNIKIDVTKKQMDIESLVLNKVESQIHRNQFQVGNISEELRAMIIERLCKKRLRNMNTIIAFIVMFKLT